MRSEGCRAAPNRHVADCSILGFTCTTVVSVSRDFKFLYVGRILEKKNRKYGLIHVRVCSYVNVGGLFHLLNYVSVF